MRISVTGGAGFIGSHVVDAYIEAGHEVFVIDNNLSGKENNINKNARYYEADICNREKIYEIFEKEMPQVITHHAAQISVAKSIENPDETMAVNVLGTTNLLHAAGEFGAERFIFASTGGAIYGNPENIFADERTPPNPLSPYGLSKFLAEESITSLSQTYGYPVVILRYANVYGPRQSAKGEAAVVPLFMELIKSDKQPMIYGDGSKTRDYVYVSDVVSANIHSLMKGDNEIINIGTGIQTTDKEVFDTIAELLGCEREPVYAPFREGEVMHIALDASFAKEILGWEPKVSFKEGIRKIFE